MPVLPVVQPLPAVSEAQVEPHLVQGRIRRAQVALAGRAALTLGVEQGFLKIERCIQQPLDHRPAVELRKALGLGQQPGQQIVGACQYDQLLSHEHLLVQRCL